MLVFFRRSPDGTSSHRRVIISLGFGQGREFMMAGSATWRPRDTHGTLTPAREAALPDSAFAFPVTRQGPLTGAGYVLEAIAHFGEYEDVTDEDRDLAFENIRKAAAHYHVSMPDTDWRQLGTRPPKPSYQRDSR